MTVTLCFLGLISTLATQVVLSGDRVRMITATDAGGTYHYASDILAVDQLDTSPIVRVRRPVLGDVNMPIGAYLEIRTTVQLIKKLLATKLAREDLHGEGELLNDVRGIYQALLAHREIRITSRPRSKSR